MKATGIVRRIDELGRVVIPKEIRRTQRIRQGDALEILPLPMGRWCSKIFPAGGAGRTGRGVYAEVLAKTWAALCWCVTGKALWPPPARAKGSCWGGRSAMPPPGCWPCAALTPRRKPLPAALRPLTKGKRCCCASAPLWCRGDVEGGVLLTGRPQDAAPDTETARAVNIAAAFFSKVDGRMNRWPASPCCLAGSKTR